MAAMAVTVQAGTPSINTETVHFSEQPDRDTAKNFNTNSAISHHLAENYVFFGQSIYLTIWYALITTVLIIFAVAYYLIKQKNTHDSGKTSIIFTSIVLLAFANFLFWSTYQNVHEFKNYQLELAKTSVNNARDQIEQFIKDKQHSLSVFTHYFKPTLLSLADNPEDKETLKLLNYEISAHFPNYYAYNLINSSSLPLLAHQSLKIGKTCRRELNHLFKTKSDGIIRLHGNTPDSYHFDIRTVFENEEEEPYIFLMNFKMDVILKILKNSQLSSQTLLIVEPDSPNQIIASVDGIQTSRLFGKQLNFQNQQLELYKAPIKNTQWLLTAYTSEALIDNYANTQWLSALIIFGSLLIVVLAFLVKLKREDNKLDALQQQLNNKKEQLEEEAYNHTLELRKTNEQLKQEIAEKNQLLETLSETQERLKFTLEGSNDALWEVNLVTGELYVSPRWSTMLAYPVGEIPSTLEDWGKLLHPDDKQKISDMTDTLKKGKLNFFQIEYRFKTRTGQYKWILNRGKVVEVDSKGTPVRAVGTHSDITSQKNAERELQRNRAHLEELISVQTADLKQAKEAAERANRSKSEFLANISHELRTPMHGILSFSSIGLKNTNEPSQDKLHSYFERIHLSGQRLLLLLNDLLDLSKLEAEKMYFNFTYNSLEDLVSLVIAELKALIAEKKLTIKMIGNEIDTSVTCDKERIMQVIHNLLSNAIKFSPPDSVITIAFSYTTIEDKFGARKQLINKQSAIRVDVKDEGVGVPINELETIFDQFVQSSKTNTGAGGTGLGLAICKEIIEGHKGVIKAHSIFGQGTTISFSLPLQTHVSTTYPDQDSENNYTENSDHKHTDNNDNSL